MKDSSRKFQELRRKHPAFHYRSFDVERKDDRLSITYSFLLEPDIEFFPRISIPLPQAIELEALRPLIFNLGLVEAISYWKSACPPIFKVAAGPLSLEQIAWWQDLFIHGLGEFYFINQLDFTIPDLLTIEAASNNALPPSQVEVLPGDLVMVGGGKDSVVSLELLRESKWPNSEVRNKAALFVNPPRSASESAEIADYPNKIILQRTLDPNLFQLNRMDYLNGHTPFSAFLAFAGVLASATQGVSHVIASNEASASEGNAVFHGLEVNHQYSKSYRFEKCFREYCKLYLHPKIEYLSFLRPLLDLQITRIFANFPQHFSSFRSCNVGQKNDRWCQSCPKCVFVYICLYPFVDRSTMIEIFGADLYSMESSYSHLRGLSGLDPVKPLECVGSREESIVAIHLSGLAHNRRGKELPPILKRILAEIPERSEAQCMQLISTWNKEHFLSEELSTLLQSELTRGALHS
jgi:hypothetical protein